MEVSRGRCRRRKSPHRQRLLLLGRTRIVIAMVPEAVATTAVAEARMDPPEMRLKTRRTSLLLKNEVSNNLSDLSIYRS